MVQTFTRRRGEKNVQKQTGAGAGEVKPVAKEKQELGASLTLSLSSLGCPSDLHFFFFFFFLSHRVCRLRLQEDDGHLVPGGLHSGASGACRGGLRHSRLALAPAGSVPAHLPLPAILLVIMLPLPDFSCQRLVGSA